jgi:hypothetical protein
MRLTSRLLRKQTPKRTVYVGSHEHKLSTLAAMHVDPDDDGRTREDHEKQQAERRRGAASGGAVFYS